MPEVLNRKDFPGTLPANTILIDRRTPWGNPFYRGTRDENCDAYEAWIVQQPELMAQLYKLRGKHLMCHCAGIGRCHGETLLRLANVDLPEMPQE